MLPVPRFVFWKHCSLSLQPSRQRHGLRSSVVDTHFGNNSNSCNRLISQSRPLSSQVAPIRLPRPISRAYLLCWFRQSGLVCFGCIVGTVVRGCCAGSTCQRPATVFSSLLAPRVARHITLSCSLLLPLSLPSLLLQSVISVLWLVLAIRAVCWSRCRNFESCTTHSL